MAERAGHYRERPQSFPLIPSRISGQGRLASDRRTNGPIGLFRSQNDRHVFRAVHFGGLLDLGDVFQASDEVVQNFAAPFVVSVLAAFELDVDLHFVLVFQKRPSLLDLEVDVVLAGLGSQPNFLELRLVRLGVVGVLLLLLVLELSEVHDAADGRPLVGADFDQIQPGLACQCQRIQRGNDAVHVAILVDDSDGRDPNLLVEPLGLVVDCCVPRQLSRSMEPTNHSSARTEEAKLVVASDGSVKKLRILRGIPSLDWKTEQL